MHNTNIEIQFWIPHDHFSDIRENLDKKINYLQTKKSVRLDFSVVFFSTSGEGGQRPYIGVITQLFFNQF